MKSLWKFLWVFGLITGCGTHGATSQKQVLIPGSSQEKRAVAIVKHLAREHGYHPENMTLEVKTDFDTGCFLIFLFPKPLNSQNLRRKEGLYAIVNAQSGQVINYSDPRTNLGK